MAQNDYRIASVYQQNSMSGKALGRRFAGLTRSR